MHFVLFVFVLHLYGFSLGMGMILAKNTFEESLLIQHASTPGSLLGLFQPPSNTLISPTPGRPPASTGRSWRSRWFSKDAGKEQSPQALQR